MANQSDFKAEIRKKQRDWLLDVSTYLGQSLSDLAESAGMSDVTLTRFVNNPDYKGALSPLNIEKIKRYANVGGPDEFSLSDPQSDLEARQFIVGLNSIGQTINAMIAAALDGRPNATAWTLQRDTLTAIGVLPGDVLIVDSSEQYYAGDIVAAQVMGGKNESPETIFRILNQPFLIGVGNHKQTREPLLIDNTRVILIGPVTQTIRGRQP